MPNLGVTFDQVSAVACGPYDYTRSGNPTRDQLEAQMADLEVPALSFHLILGSIEVCIPREEGRDYA